MQHTVVEVDQTLTDQCHAELPRVSDFRKEDNGMKLYFWKDEEFEIHLMEQMLN